MIELGVGGLLGAAWAWVIRAASRMRKPQRRLGEVVVMLVRTSLMLLIQWADLLGFLLALGGGVRWAEVVDFLDLIFLLTLSPLFFPWLTPS